MSGRSYVKILTIVDGAASYNVYADTGAVPSVTAENTGDLTILPGGLFRWDGAAWVNVTSTASFPSGVIVVATAGGQHTTVAAGLAAAGAGDVVIVYPGTYAESVTIPSNVRLVGFESAEATIISGSNTTSTRITMSDPGTLQSITVIAPSAGGNPAIDCSGLGAGEVAVVQNINIQGAGGTGHGIVGAGVGVLVGISIYQNGGALGGALAACSGGDMTLRELVGRSGSAADFCLVSGGEMRGQVWLAQPSTVYTATNGLRVSGGRVNVQGLQVDRGTSPFTNALNITADGVTITVGSSDLAGTSTDVLIGAALTGTGSSIIFYGTVMERSEVSAPDGYREGCDTWILSFTDTGASGDNAGNKVEGNLDIGTPEKPSSLSTGEGDSTVLGMVAYTFDDGLGSYNDVTTELRSPSGSTATWNGDDNDGLYIGFSAAHKPRMFDIENVTALAGGTLAVEVWTGAAWTSINYMSASSGGLDQYAKTVFQRASSDENLRLNTDGTAWSSWTSNDPPATGTNRYWLRIRNDGAVTTRPTIERLKVGTSFHEWKGTGVERFGAAEIIRTIPDIALRLTDDLSGASPSNEPIDYGTIINITPVDNEFQNNVTDGFGLQYTISQGIDTSRPLTFSWRFAQVSGTPSGNVDFDLRLGQIQIGTVLNGAQTETVIPLTPHTTSGTQDEVEEASASLDISDFIPGDTLIIALRRLGGDASDTFGGHVYITQLIGMAVFFN